MAVYCANCGTEQREGAPTCHNCGHPVEAIAAAVPYAGFGERVLALIIDNILLGIAGGIIFRGNSWTASFVIGFLYSWLMLAFNDGRTVGKMVLGIRIANPDGSPVDLGTSAARAGMSIVSGLALGIGYLWAAWDPEQRTWHDIVADTRAFKQPR